MFNDSIIYTLLAAYILDMIFGDPRWLPHPVVWMGNAISFFEPYFRRFTKNQFVTGLLFAIFLISSSWGLAFALIKIFSMIHPFAGIAVEVILMFFCLSARTLEKAASEVDSALNNQKTDNCLEAARIKVSMIVGREVKYLDETGVIKAAIETVAENFVDGFLSPICFALVFGVPAAVAYKMINTLDSMVGYKNDKYILFGKASAKIDDVANFIPARISVVIISIAVSLISFKRGIVAFKTALKEGRDHKSPNSGYPEAAFAGALKIKLGGPNYYHGKLVEKPYIGKRFGNPGKGKIRMACELMLFSSLIAILITITIKMLLFYIKTS
ncbi:MAG: cobalamin biosynthesis protein CobD [Desulfamplus sp.]|nr:cobalamin biosynthesis protein CobD [Desulfamplus sp.]